MITPISARAIFSSRTFSSAAMSGCERSACKELRTLRRKSILRRYEGRVLSAHVEHAAQILVREPRRQRQPLPRERILPRASAARTLLLGAPPSPRVRGASVFRAHPLRRRSRVPRTRPALRIARRAASWRARPRQRPRHARFEIVIRIASAFRKRLIRRGFPRILDAVAMIGASRSAASSRPTRSGGKR